MSVAEQSGLAATALFGLAGASGIELPAATGSKLAQKSGAYSLRFAECKADLEAVSRLRFLVFNLELGEGLDSAYQDGQDNDEFDGVCDHLLVEHSLTGQVVGTYRLQAGQV